PPEVEDTDAIGVELFRQLERALEQLVLLGEGERRAELGAGGAELGLRRAGPVDLEDRRRDARDADVELVEESPGVGHLLRVPAHDVLLVDLAQVDVAEAELLRGDLQRATEILRDLIAEYRDLERVGVRRR